MKNERDIVHRLLDGDVPAAEKDAIIKQIQDDPVLRKEFDDLSGAVGLLEQEGRLKPPLAFTASVMRRLPRRADALPARLKRFFFGSRVLRWNVATAMALVLLTVVSLAVMKLMTNVNQEAGRTSVSPGGVVQTVRLTFVAPAAKRVAVAGDFNKWRTDSNLMTRENGMWTIELPLTPGVYTYMFIVDDEQWVTDPRAESYRDDGFGYRNAVMRVSI
jgi:Glycogen recognition site of AMP-activated protein kinase